MMAAIVETVTIMHTMDIIWRKEIRYTFTVVTTMLTVTNKKATDTVNGMTG